MKKILSITVAVLVLCSCFVFTVAAEGGPITLSDDYSELYVDSDTYIQVEDTSLYVECDFVVNNEVTLNEAQSKTIRSVELYSNDSGNIIEAYIEMKIGSSARVVYMNSDSLMEYNVLKNSREYTVDFIYPEGNTVKASYEALFGKPDTLYEDDLVFCDFYYVYTASSESGMSLCKGMVLSGLYYVYYLDFEQAGIEDPYDFSPYEATELDVYKITDPSLESDLIDAELVYYGEDPLDENSETDLWFGGAVVLLFVVVILLLGVFVTFLVLGICSKTEYRKLFLTISIIAACGLAVVIAIAVYAFSVV